MPPTCLAVPGAARWPSSSAQRRWPHETTTLTRMHTLVYMRYAAPVCPNRVTIINGYLFLFSYSLIRVWQIWVGAWCMKLGLDILGYSWLCWVRVCSSGLELDVLGYNWTYRVRVGWFGLGPPHTAQTQTNGQLPLSNHSVASHLTRLAKMLHWTIPPQRLPITQ